MKRFITLLFIMCVAVMTWGQTYSAELERKARGGNAEAQCQLGYCYYFGKGITEDRAEAVKWFRKAAEQGHAKAQYQLGCCYDRGWGITEDNAEAVKWYRKAAEQGCEDAYFSLGLYHQYNTKNKEEAIYWYKKSADSCRYPSVAIENLKELGVDYSPGESTSYASSSSSSSSSTSSRSTSSSKSELLYSGIYTKSSQGYTAESGQYTDGGFDFQVNVEIYNDYIKVLSTRYDYVRTSGEWKVYGGKDNGFGGTEYYYVNPSTYAMKYVLQSYFAFTGGYTTTTYAMAKGEVIFQKQYNSNNGYSSSGSSYGSGNSNSSGTTRHTCNLCNGQRRIVKDTYPPLYGQSNYQVKCNECGGYFLRSIGHTHVTCPQCHGKGYFTTD